MNSYFGNVLELMIELYHQRQDLENRLESHACDKPIRN